MEGVGIQIHDAGEYFSIPFNKSISKWRDEWFIYDYPHPALPAYELKSWSRKGLRDELAKDEQVAALLKMINVLKKEKKVTVETIIRSFIVHEVQPVKS